MPRGRLFALVLLSTPMLTGCLAAKLRGPAQDHYIQTKTIADSCEADGYGAGKCTKADLQAMVDQAECIMKISENQTCEGGE